MYRKYHRVDWADWVTYIIILLSKDQEGRKVIIKAAPKDTPMPLGVKGQRESRVYYPPMQCRTVAWSLTRAG